MRGRLAQGDLRPPGEGEAPAEPICGAGWLRGTFALPDYLPAGEPDAPAVIARKAPGRLIAPFSIIKGSLPAT